MCLSHANNEQSTLWAEEGQVPIHPTTQGRGIMVIKRSLYISKCNSLNTAALLV